MSKIRLSPSDYQIFFLKSFLWLGFGWATFGFALAGFFYANWIWLAFIIFSIGALFWVIRRRVSILPSREFLFIGLAIVAIVTILSFFVTPTVFSGRDQGSISEAAIRLAQNHSFTFSTPASETFFAIHGPGKAQNFPGFFYTNDGKLITQFPLAYITWLAMFYGIFGLTGLIVANAVLFAFFMMSFYLLIRIFASLPFALLSLVFATTSLPMIWFVKFTLSENMALMLIWICILSLTVFLREPRRLYLGIYLLSALLLFFTRIEGIALIVTSGALIACNRESREFISEKISTRLLIPFTVFAIYFVANTFTDIHFYKEIIKALFPSLSAPQAKLLGDLSNVALPNHYILQIFAHYGMLSFFVAGLAGIIYFVYKKNTYALVPFMVIAPTVIYFFDAHISSDHPWMLRRFVFTLLPAAIFYATLLLSTWFKRGTHSYQIVSVFIAASLLFTNMPAFLKFATYSENKTLLTQTQQLSKQFSNTDLILLDRSVTNDGWNMISGPMSFLFDKNAVYFFNIQDIARLQLNTYQHVFLITPNDRAQYYENSTLRDRLTQTGEYSLTTDHLDISSHGSGDIQLPDIAKQTIQGKIYSIAQ